MWGPHDAVDVCLILSHSHLHIPGLNAAVNKNWLECNLVLGSLMKKLALAFKVLVIHTVCLHTDSSPSTCTKRSFYSQFHANQASKTNHFHLHLILMFPNWIAFHSTFKHVNTSNWDYFKSNIWVACIDEIASNHYCHLLLIFFRARKNVWSLVAVDF